MSLSIDTQKITLFKKSELPHALCEAYAMGEHHRTFSQVINYIDWYKQATKKEKYLMVI